MSDPIPAGPRAQFRALFRSLVLDPALLFARAFDPDDLARAAAEVAGRTADRIFTPLTTLAVFLAQVSSDDHSCRSAVARLLAWRAARGLRPCSPDTGAYCKARRRLPEDLPHRLVREAGDRLSGRAPDAWSFQGRRVVIADGTTVTMPDTPENQAAYPQHFAQRPGCGSPIAQMVVLLCLATGAVLDAAIGRRVGQHTGEHALLRSLHGRLRRGDILLADSYYASYPEVATLRALGVDVVMRQHGGRATDFRRGVRLGREDHLVCWERGRARRPWLGREQFAALPRRLPMRELRVRIDKPGFRTRSLVVVTTLDDAAAFPARQLADLYRRRWQAELDIRSIKAVMGMDVLRCKSPAMVHKEVWAHLLAYNLVRGAMAGAAHRHGAAPRELSLQGARQTLEAFRAEGAAGAEIIAAVLRAIAYHRVGDRPDRVEPRVVKRRPKAYPRMQEPRREARRRLMRMA